MTFADGSEMHVYRIRWKVRPTPRHPAYFSFECGLLSVWLLDSDPEQAAIRAHTLAECLPFELVGECWVDEWNGNPPDPQNPLAAQNVAAIKETLEAAAGIYFAGMEVGADADRFFASDVEDGEEWKRQ